MKTLCNLYKETTFSGYLIQKMQGSTVAGFGSTILGC